MSAPRIILASLPSFGQKLSKLVEIWRSSGTNNFAQFFETRCMVSNSNKQKPCMSMLNVKMQSNRLWRHSIRHCSYRAINILLQGTSAATVRNIWWPKNHSKVSRSDCQKMLDPNWDHSAHYVSFKLIALLSRVEKRVQMLWNKKKERHKKEREQCS